MITIGAGQAGVLTSLPRTVQWTAEHLRAAIPSVALLLILGGCSPDESDNDREALNDSSGITTDNTAGPNAHADHEPSTGIGGNLPILDLNWELTDYRSGDGEEVAATFVPAYSLTLFSDEDARNSVLITLSDCGWLEGDYRLDGTTLQTRDVRSVSAVVSCAGPQEGDDRTDAFLVELFAGTQTLSAGLANDSLTLTSMSGARARFANGGPSDGGSDGSADSGITSLAALYIPLLDNVPPPVECDSNCALPLRGTEWRAVAYTGPLGDYIEIDTGVVHTLLFSEIDTRVVGRMACNELAGTYLYEGGSMATPLESDGRLELDGLAVTEEACALSEELTVHGEQILTYLADDTLVARVDVDTLVLTRANGEQLRYRGRANALDGVIRPFRTIATGDRLGDTFDETVPASGFAVYDSADDFRARMPNLAALVGDAVSGIDFERETLVGLFIEPLEYLGPAAQGTLAIERADEVELETFTGLFWCDNGVGQPRGDNAPYSLIAIETTKRPVVRQGIAGVACP